MLSNIGRLNTATILIRVIEWITHTEKRFVKLFFFTDTNLRHLFQISIRIFIDRFIYKGCIVIVLDFI